jgi:hypothetical protein
LECPFTKVFNMSREEQHPRRTFTLEQANASLPLVKAIVSDLAELARDVGERQDRLAVLTVDCPGKGLSAYSDELEQVQKDLAADHRRLNEYFRELVDLGVEPKGAVDGLVDFPCQMDGRLVYLCWKLGEPSVSHWHELEAGFAGRQILPKHNAESLESRCS